MKWLLVAMLISGGADVVTTELAIDKGFSEYNPLMKNRTARVAAHVVAPLFIYYASRGLSRKRRVIYMISATTLWSFMAARNINIMVTYSW